MDAASQGLKESGRPGPPPPGVPRSQAGGGVGYRGTSERGAAVTQAMSSDLLIHSFSSCCLRETLLSPRLTRKNLPLILLKGRKETF